MRFQPTELAGAYVVEPEPVADDRGLFARTFCQREFAAHGLASAYVQCNTSFNIKRGTLRGMHFQTGSHAEDKVVRCTQGAIFDVIVDLRPESASYCRWQGFELTAANRLGLFVPAGFAHGFQTLCDNAEVFYMMSNFFHPDAAAGVRWDDPAFGIGWPLPAPILSPRDRAYADFRP